MQASKKFKDLIVWQKTHQIVLMVYEITGNFPKSETFGLTPQFSRAAISTPTIIAEGLRKRGKNDKVIFLNISQGSLEEYKYNLILAKDLEYLEENELLMNLAEEIGKLLDVYSKAILSPDFRLLILCLQEY